MLLSIPGPAALLPLSQGWPKIAAEQKVMQTAPGFIHQKSELPRKGAGDSFVFLCLSDQLVCTAAAYGDTRTLHTAFNSCSW